MKDGSYAAAGAVIFVALRIVDVVQTAVRVQSAKRPLTARERDLLRPIFRDSLTYDRIRLVDGRTGILTSRGRAMTMGHTIYLPTYREQTLVHECVHVWQYETSGLRYIGNSALNQLAGMTIRRGYDPYQWRQKMDAGTSWDELRSVEAQAKFIEDVFAAGTFAFESPGLPDDTAPGAFFREDEAGHNAFDDRGRRDCTDQANAAWRIIRS